MKIAYISNLIEPTGGDLILYHHVMGMQKLGHSIDIYFNQWKDSSRFKPWKEIEDQIIFFKDIDHLRKLSKKDYDIVVANGLTGIMYTIHLKPKNYIWFCQNFDPYLFGRKENIDRVYTTNQKFLLYSHSLADIIENHYGKKEISFCKNGIDYSKYQPFQKKKNSKSKRVCYMVAYHHPTKGSRLANKVFTELKKRGFDTVEISIEGGPLSSTTEYYNNPSFEKKIQILSNCDVLLHASYFETWCLIVMESMAVGTPVVGTNSLGIKEYTNSENSIILDHRDPIRMCDEIESICSDNEKYEKIQKNGITTAEKYDWELIMPEIESSYLQLI